MNNLTAYTLIGLSVSVAFLAFDSYSVAAESAKLKSEVIELKSDLDIAKACNLHLQHSEDNNFYVDDVCKTLELPTIKN